MIPGIDPKVDYAFKKVFVLPAFVDPSARIAQISLDTATLKNPLDLWTYFLIHGDELDKDNLPEPLRNSPVQQAMEVLSMMTQSELERDRYEARLKGERDHRARLLEGVESGIEKGEIIGQIHLCQDLLKTDSTPRAQLVAMSVEELRAVAAELKKQLDVAK